ncbi:hypothetical protein BACEGG_02981 [Bacteroides eggerthii DSM 20697]|nr:hypothetical protein BACEGG_02981 [Bacteroides eggerthii DSM 20697]
MASSVISAFLISIIICNKKECDPDKECFCKGSQSMFSGNASGYFRLLYI